VECPRLIIAPSIGIGDRMQRKVFWLSFIILSLIADFTLPLLWGVLATLPIAALSWWIAYRSDWF
jgi:chromate transport protein ChrA